MFLTGYSYKGGVGRSTALANIACLLAEDPDHPQKVLMWDFDLEAPGVHRLFPAKNIWRSGFVDLAYDFASTGELRDPTDFIYHSIVPGIDVLPAGHVDECYCDKISRIDWPRFFGDNPKERGPFFDWMAQWATDAGYDYVFIDSRTGLSDAAGICTQILPDVVLVLFRLTEQNIDGISHIVPAIRDQLARRSREGVAVLPVVSPVLSQSSSSSNELRGRAEDIFSSDSLHYIRFDADLIAEERLFCLQRVRSQLWPEPPVIEDYQRLSRIIRQLNANDTHTLYSRLRRSMGQSDFASARQILPSLIKRRPHLSDVWRNLRAVCRNTANGLEFGDQLVDEIEEAGDKNIYSLEWQAAKHVAAATSPVSKELSAAIKCMQEAVAEAPRRTGLYRQLAEIAECTGDLELAMRSRESAHEMAAQNFQNVLDLAHLYVRRGRDYFMLAKKLLEPHENKLQSPILVYLYSFFNEEFHAGRALEEMRKAKSVGTSDQYMRLVKGYSLLFLGKEREALALAKDRPVDGDVDVGNWAEFFLCVGAFGEAISIVESAREKRETHGDASTYQRDYGGLVKLAKYLDPSSSNIAEDDVIKGWMAMSRTALSWNFLELLFFREYARKEDQYKCPERFEVIEKLIRICNLGTSTGNKSILWRRGAASPHSLFLPEGWQTSINIKLL